MLLLKSCQAVNCKQQQDIFSPVPWTLGVSEYQYRNPPSSLWLPHCSPLGSKNTRHNVYSNSSLPPILTTGEIKSWWRSHAEGRQRAYTANNNPYSCNLSNNTSFMTLLRGWEIEKTMRNHSNNIVLTISENKLCVRRKKILCLTLFLFLFFISIVSLPVSLTTGHWSPAPVISEDHVLMPGPGLITGPWQKPSDYIRLWLAQGRGPEAGPVFLTFSNNKVFVPARNWFWRCCIKLLMVDILTSGKCFLEQPGPSNIYNSNLIFVHERLWTFDVLRFYFDKSKVLQRGCFTSPRQQWALLMLMLISPAHINVNIIANCEGCFMNPPE